LEPAEPENTDQCGIINVAALLSTLVLFVTVCCLPNALFYPERFESCPSLGTTSMIRSLQGLGQIQQGRYEDSSFLPAYEDGTVFRNVGTENSDAGESLRRKHTTVLYIPCLFH
jgi:hypothetical protein